MRPRITEQSYRPRVSDRTMRYRLFKADNRHLLVSFRRPNGVVTTRTWNHSGEEKKVSRLQRKTTLSRIECARSKQVGLNAETKKGVGIEPTGEIFLLTFTLIGPFCATTIRCLCSIALRIDMGFRWFRSGLRSYARA